MTALPSPSNPTIDAINSVIAERHKKEPPREYLGGSIIGDPCERKLWYGFRLAHNPEEFSGQQLRLFNTGHVEEARMIEWLGMTGISVHEADPATGEQWAVSAVEDHFGGHLDGIVLGLLEAPKTEHLLECKTHNEKSFKQLKDHGVAVSKPVHMAQMQVYMHLKGLSRAFYFAKHKDSDELYSERVHYDPAQAMALIAKAERIIKSDRVPARVSDNPDHYLCKSFKCPAYGLCHEGEFAIRNCRTCLHSQPVHGGKWHCNRHDRDLTFADQRHGCPNHLYLPDLVPGEQVDADEHAETVTYAMRDCSEWVDGGERLMSANAGGVPA